MQLLTLFFAALLASTATSSSSRKRNAEGQAGYNVQETLKGICLTSLEVFAEKLQYSERLFRGWAKEAKTNGVRSYFWSKPVNTPPTSICSPMNTTCCRLSAENHMARIAQREYGELFLNITQDNLRSCFVIGRHFYHAMYSTFMEMQRQLTNHVSNELDNKLPLDFFQQFFHYLSSFLVSSDLCDLPMELQTVMRNMFDFIYSAQQGENLHSDCYLNVSAQIMEPFYQGLFIGLERQLYNLDLIFRAMKVAEDLVKRMRYHRFAPECLKPFSQLQYCTHCTGYSKFKPCLFFCINVFRGCFADIADLHRDFQHMFNVLSVIPDELLPMFQPEIFIRDSLHYFVELAKELIDRNLKNEIEAACNGQRRPIVRQQLSSLPSTVSPAEQDSSLNEAFEIELRCVGDVGSLLNTIPDEMCYLNKEYKTVADTGNRVCWTGRSLGSYTDPMVPSSKEHQVNNPVFANSSLPFSDQYVDLHFDISIITAELNATLEDILCLDDEDCRSAPFYICEEEGSASLGSGSGSSSGSGSGGMEDGFRDMETRPTPHFPGVPTDDSTSQTPPVVTKPPWNYTDTDDEDEGYEVIDIPGQDSPEDTAGPQVPNRTSDLPTSPTPTPHEEPGVIVSIPDEDVLVEDGATILHSINHGLILLSGILALV